MKHPHISIESRKIGEDYTPFVIAEIGINHEGDMKKAKQMIRDAKKAGAECVKFQSHVIEDEMSAEAKKVIPGNAKESIYTIMERCALNEKQERELKMYTEKNGMIFLSTPFSRAAADRLERIGVSAYKIGSGECNNYPLIEHIASFGKPVIVSTGMNDIASVREAVKILRRRKIPYALMHCTSMYPTPYGKVRLGAIAELKKAFPDAVLGLSDHSLGNYTCYGSVALGASILEKHFTSSMQWKGPDIPISITPEGLQQLIKGSSAIYEARGGKKTILQEEQPTIDFAYATVVVIQEVQKGAIITRDDVWVKRPGTGEIRAADLNKVIGRRAKNTLRNDQHLRWRDLV
ncbi:MAG: N-acetylneuraminate synthase family protein [bacterium]|nr:N-acetylneuraminate synthase family protein [bacterium]